MKFSNLFGGGKKKQKKKQHLINAQQANILNDKFISGINKNYHYIF